tara:strand:+ start:162 stop:710 length:549 start_codon:yes stop_codon:yes gene_type:complete
MSEISTDKITPRIKSATKITQIDADSKFPAGHVIQTLGIMQPEVDTTTSIIPNDNTIPQNTEGKEAFSLAITPSNVNNKLLIHAFCGCISSDTTNRRCYFTLFKDSDTDAIAAAYADFQAAATGEQGLDLTHFMTAGTTSEITFKIRFGASNTGTCTLNGSSGARLLGGVLATGMTIQEIAG